MARKYAESTYQCGRYQALGWDVLCSEREIWEPEVVIPANPIVVYTSDASEYGPEDLDGAWTDGANAFDDSLLTYAETQVDGSASSNFLMARGFSGEFLDLPIKTVRHRMYGLITGTPGIPAMYADLWSSQVSRGRTTMGRGTVPEWSAWVQDASILLGGWTTAELGNLEIRLYAWDIKDLATITARVYKVELEVEYDYGWQAEAGNDDPWSETDPRV